MIRTTHPTFAIDWGNSITKGMVGCWLMDEGNGKIAADLVGQSDGEFPSGFEPTWQKSRKLGNAVKFDATNDIIVTNANNKLNNLGPLTVSAWCQKLSPFSSSARLVSKENVSGAGEGMWYVSNVSTGAITFVKGGSTNLVRTSSNVIFLNNIHHIVVTWDGSTTAANVHIYIDGIEGSYSTTTNGATLNSDAALDFNIGNRTNKGTPWNGFIKNVQLWNRVLKANEVRALYSNPTSILVKRKRIVYFPAGGSGAVNATATPSVALVSVLAVTAQASVTASPTASVTIVSVTVLANAATASFTSTVVASPSLALITVTANTSTVAVSAIAFPSLCLVTLQVNTAIASYSQSSSVVPYLVIKKRNVLSSTGVSFDAVSDYLNTGKALVTNYPLTLCAWFKPRTLHAGTIITVQEAAVGDNWFRIYASLGGFPTLDVNGSAYASLSSAAPYKLNRWNFICGVFASSTSRTIYFNGKNAASDSTAHTILLAPTDTQIGALVRPSPTNFFDGSIAGPALWNVALSADEVLTLYKLDRIDAPLFVKRSNLLGLWPLNDYSPGRKLNNRRFADKSRNGNVLIGNIGTEGSGLRANSGIDSPFAKPFRKRIVIGSRASSINIVTATPSTSFISVQGNSQAASFSSSATASPSLCLISVLANQSTASAGITSIAQPSVSLITVLANTATSSTSVSSTAQPSASLVSILANQASASANGSQSATATPSTAFITVQVNTAIATGGGNATAQPSIATITITVNTPTFQFSRNVEALPGTNIISFSVPTPTASVQENRIATPSVCLVTVVVYTPSAGQLGASGISIAIILRSKIEKTIVQNSGINKTILEKSRIEKYLTLESEI